MPFYSQITGRNEFLLSITHAMKTLRELEEVNKQIIEDTKADLHVGLETLLKTNKITREDYSQQMEQLSEELSDRLQAQTQIRQNIVRFENTLNQKNDSMCFVIPENIGKKELTSLMKIAISSLKTCKDEDEKSLLRAIIPSLETHQNMLDASKEIPKKFIPITKNEERYLIPLLEKLYGLNLDAINAYQMQLDKLKKLRESAGVKALSKESNMVDNLLNSIIKETELTLIGLSTQNPNQENIVKDYRANVEKYLERASEQAKELKGLKKFINKICELIGAEPVFLSEKNITHSLKTSFFYTKQKNGEKNQPEEDNAPNQNSCALCITSRA
jgi:hypothetical protein